jgi:hypothetical protein
VLKVFNAVCKLFILSFPLVVYGPHYLNKQPLMVGCKPCDVYYYCLS